MVCDVCGCMLRWMKWCMKGCCNRNGRSKWMPMLQKPQKEDRVMWGELAMTLLSSTRWKRRETMRNVHQDHTSGPWWVFQAHPRNTHDTPDHMCMLPVTSPSTSRIHTFMWGVSADWVVPTLTTVDILHDDHWSSHMSYCTVIMFVTTQY